MKKAELRIGNKAYTLIEVLSAIVIISIGVTFIFPIMFRSAQIISYLPDRFEADIFLNNLFVRAEESFCKKGFLASVSSSGEEEINGNKCSYETRFLPLDTTGGIYQVNGEVSWRDFKGNKISKTAYIAR